MATDSRAKERPSLLRRVLLGCFLLAFVAAGTWQARILRESQLEAELIQTHANLVLDTLPVAILICDDRGRVTRCNAEAENLLGWRASELVGRPVARLLRPGIAERHSLAFHDAAARLQARDVGWQVTRIVQGDVLKQDETWLPVEVRMRGIAHNGEVEFLAAVFPHKLTPEQQNSPYQLRVNPDLLPKLPKLP